MSTRSKVHSWLALAAVCLLVMAACGSDPTATPTATSPGATPTEGSGTLEDQLYQAALDEGGVVVIWDSSDPEDIGPIFDAFEAKYPGIEVQHVTGSEATSLYQKYILEHDANNVTMDVMNAGADYLPPLVERNVFMDLTELAADVGAEDWLELDGQLWRDGINVAGIPYNTNLVSEEEAPRDWDDLLDPKWKGQIVVESRLQPYVLRTDIYNGAREGDYWSQEETVEFLEQLGEQDIVTHQGNSASLQQIISGEKAILAGNWLSSVWRAMQDGAPIGWSPIPTIVGEQTLAWASVKAPHPNGAKLYVRWRLSEDGFAAKTSVFPEDLPYGNDNPAAQLLAEKGNEILLAGPEIFEEYEDIQETYLEAIGIQ